MGNLTSSPSKQKMVSSPIEKIGSDVSKEPNLNRIHTVGSILNPKLLGEALSKLDGSKSSIKDNVPEFLLKLAVILKQKTLEEQKLKGISRQVFQQYLCPVSKDLGNMLYDYFVSEIDGVFDGPMLPRKALKTDEFLEQANVIFNRFTDDQQTTYYAQVFSSDGFFTREEFEKLVLTSYTVAQYAHHCEASDDDLLHAIVKSAMRDKESHSLKYILNFINENCPRMVGWMHRYIIHHLTVGYSTIPSNKQVDEDDNGTPILEKVRDNSISKKHAALVWMLACALPTIYIKDIFAKTPSPEAQPMEYIYNMIHGTQQKPNHWVVLYNSSEDGISINRFQHHVFDYHGPTLVFVTGRVTGADGKVVEYKFCIASDEIWHDSIQYYGNDCMLIQLLPNFRVIERGSKMMYLNLTSRGFPFGFMIGLDKKNVPLTIDAQLETADYKQGIVMNLVRVEAWGCGNTAAHDTQKEMKKIHVRDVESRRKVNLNSGDWRSNPDRSLLEMGGKISVNYSQNGR